MSGPEPMEIGDNPSAPLSEDEKEWEAMDPATLQQRLRELAAQWDAHVEPVGEVPKEPAAEDSEAPSTAGQLVNQMLCQNKP